MYDLQMIVMNERYHMVTIVPVNDLGTLHKNDPFISFSRPFKTRRTSISITLFKRYIKHTRTLETYPLTTLVIVLMKRLVCDACSE